MDATAPQLLQRADAFGFDAMSLQVGTRLQLLVKSANQTLQHFTVLIGYVANEYLLVRLPSEHGGLAAGDAVQVRVFSGVHVFSFVSYVERVLMSPFYQLYLTFPTTIQGTALRGAIRVKLDLPAQLGEGADAVAQAPTTRIVNLSVSGALVHAAQRMGSIGDELPLSFSFVIQPGGFPVSLNTTASIKSVQAISPAAAAPGWAHGVSFGANPDEQVKLQNLVYQTLLSSRQNVV